MAGCIQALPPTLSHFHTLQELCEGGDWFQRLVSGGTYTEDMAADIVRTMLKAIAYCHSLGVVHRCGCGKVHTPGAAVAARRRRGGGEGARANVQCVCGLEL
eukprot:357205-Chlamydomonas_euryale.AAC.1